MLSLEKFNNNKTTTTKQQQQQNQLKQQEKYKIIFLEEGRLEP